MLASLRRDDLPILSAWQGPLRSLGSTRLEPRTCFIAYCNENVPRLDLRLAMESIRRKVVSPGLLIGAQNLFAEDDALLFDIQSPAALASFSSMIDEIVLASGRLAVGKTSTPAERWCDALTETLEDSCGVPISSVRYRSERHDGKIFAKPRLLPRQLRQSRQRQAPAALTSAEPPPLYQLHVRLEGASCPSPDQVIQAIFDEITNKLGTRFTRSAGDLLPDQWKTETQ